MSMINSLGKTGGILGLTAIAIVTLGSALLTHSLVPPIGDSVESPRHERMDAERTGGEKDESHPDVEKQIKAFIIHYIATLEGKNEKAIRALFIEDDRFAWFTDGVKSYATIDDVLAGMRKYAGIRFETTISRIHVVPLSASLASVRSKFRTKLTIPGAENHEYGGVITWLLEKAPASDEWKVILGHTSTPGGPPNNDYKGGKQ